VGDVHACHTDPELAFDDAADEAGFAIERFETELTGPLDAAHRVSRCDGDTVVGAAAHVFDSVAVTFQHRLRIGVHDAGFRFLHEQVWNSLKVIENRIKATAMKISPSRGFISVYLTATIAAACLSGTPLLAQTPQVEVALQARRVVVDQGKEALVPADKAKPGDVIQYEASYHNAGKAPVQHLGAVIPIPVGLALTADSAVPAASDAVDDDLRPVARPDGSYAYAKYERFESGRVVKSFSTISQTFTCRSIVCGSFRRAASRAARTAGSFVHSNRSRASSAITGRSSTRSARNRATTRSAP